MREVKLGLESGWQRRLEEGKSAWPTPSHTVSGADKGSAGGMQGQAPASLLQAWPIFGSSAGQKLGA